MNGCVDPAVRERKQINLRIPREDQADIEETVDPRRLVGVAPVERTPCLTEPRHRTHDAVRLEDSDRSIRSERCRHSAEWLRFQECIGLEQFRAGQPYPPGSG